MPFLPFFVSELGVDESSAAFWAGMVMSGAGLMFALSAPVWGILADRFGRKAMVCRAMAAGTVVLFLMSFAQSVGQLFICSLLQGAFTGTLAASVALVASVVPSKRSGLALGMMQAAAFIGMAIGPSFGGIVADAMGYRASFRMGAVLCLIGGMIVYFGTHEEQSPRPSSSSKSIGLRKVFMVKGFLLAVLVMFGGYFGNSMINPAFPLVVKEILPEAKLLNSITGMVVASTAVAAAISSAAVGHIGDKFGQRKVLLACCTLACVSSGWHYWAGNLTQLIFARMLFGLAVAGTLPAANSMINSMMPRESLGKAYGLANSLGTLGVALGPLAGGYLGSHAGLRVPFLATAGAQFMLGLVVFLFARRLCQAPPTFAEPADATTDN